MALYKMYTGYPEQDKVIKDHLIFFFILLLYDVCHSITLITFSQEH